MKKLLFKKISCFTLAFLTLFGIVGLYGCQTNGGKPVETDPTPDDSTTPDSDAADDTTTSPESSTVDPALSSQYVVVTDYITPNTSRDLAADIQKIIDDNPNRTIFFPDGTYIIGSTIKTSAASNKSVSILMSDFAKIKASSSFSYGKPMFSLGGLDSKANNISAAGSNYSFIGGILDCNSRAYGICLEAGRETLVRDISIKNAVIGIHIKYGVNNGSSDHDIEDVNIVGTGKNDSIGVLCEGCDNTFTNMRIGKVYVGVKVTANANIFRNIHPLYFESSFEESFFKNSCGFWDLGGYNWYDYCYSDQFAIGFKLKDGVSSIFHNCQAFWWTNAGGKQVFFEVDGKFNSVVTNGRADFKSNATYKSILDVKKDGGTGVFENLIMRRNAVVQNEIYRDYLKNPVILFG